MTRDYDSTVARIAGNIAAGLVRTPGYNGRVAEDAVELARAIVAEVRRTEPEHAEGPIMMPWRGPKTKGPPGWEADQLRELWAQERAVNAELLAALKTLHDAVVRHGVTEGEGPGWLSAFQNLMTAVRAAADAIAKAEGRS